MDLKKLKQIEITPAQRNENQVNTFGIEMSLDSDTILENPII